MAFKYKCARCGRELMPFKGARSVTILAAAPVKSFDLCSKCYEEFMELVDGFLKGEKEEKSIEDDIVGLLRDVAYLGHKLEEIEERFEKLEGRVSKLEEKIEDLEYYIEEAEEK